MEGMEHLEAECAVLGLGGIDVRGKEWKKWIGWCNARGTYPFSTNLKEVVSRI